MIRATAAASIPATQTILRRADALNPGDTIVREYWDAASESHYRRTFIVKIAHPFRDAKQGQRIHVMAGDRVITFKPDDAVSVIVDAKGSSK